VKAPAFRYARPATVEEALALLAAHGEDATVLAGGQSLLAALNMRLATPALLIDINRLAPLGGIEERGDAIRIGALARHAEVAASPLVARHAPLIAQAMPHVAHVAVRNRGTFGGSLALADPAAELPACAVALGARLVLESAARGRRTVQAEAFFKELYTTDRAADEMLIEIEVPKRPSWRVGFGEFSRRQGDFAMVGLAAAAELSGPTVGQLRLVYFGSESHARLAGHAAAAARGRPLDRATEDAIIDALDRDLNPMGNLQGRPDTKRHLAKILTRRVLAGLTQGEQTRP
jgi:aerobic carbon-monoxide dehydrogenase medium subunit